MAVERRFRSWARAYLVIAIVSAAALSIGVWSGLAQRLLEVEAASIGARDAAVWVRSGDVVAAISAISDIRASAGFRTDAATELLRHLLTRALT